MIITISSLTVQNYMVFFDKDLTCHGRYHNLALHIIVEAHGKRIPQVLVDNGSMINVMPLKTSSCLGLQTSDFTSSAIIVRAYDNTQTEVIGIINLKVTIGPVLCAIKFQVLEKHVVTIQGDAALGSQSKTGSLLVLKIQPRDDTIFLSGFIIDDYRVHYIEMGMSHEVAPDFLLGETSRPSGS